MTTLVVGAVSHIGRVRRRNEDHFLVDRRVDNLSRLQIALSPTQLPPCGLLCAVADGLGGHAGGDVASRLALDTLTHRYPFQAPAITMDDIGAQLRRVVPEVDAAI